MKVILREDIKTKGTAGSVIEVKRGYARNYLIPNGLAYVATEGNMKVYDRDRIQKGTRMEQQRVDALKQKEEIDNVSLTAVEKMSDEGRLFGSVTSQTISDLLKEKGYDIASRKIMLEEPIKELGVYEVKVSLFQDITATLKLWVVKE